MHSRIIIIKKPKSFSSSASDMYFLSFWEWLLSDTKPECLIHGWSVLVSHALAQRCEIRLENVFPRLLGLFNTSRSEYGKWWICRLLGTADQSCHSRRDASKLLISAHRYAAKCFPTYRQSELALTFSCSFKIIWMSYRIISVFW